MCYRRHLLCRRILHYSELHWSDLHRSGLRWSGSHRSGEIAINGARQLVCTGQVRTGQSCTAQVHTGQVRTGQICTGQVHTAQVCKAQVRTRTNQVAINELPIGRQCSTAVTCCAAGFYIAQSCTGQVHTGQVHTAQVRTGQVCIRSGLHRTNHQ